MDYETPLRWEHEDGRSGTHVRDVPLSGRVFWFDEDGPVGRFDDAAEVRWWHLHKFTAQGEQHFRIVRMVGGDGAAHFVMPGHVGVIDCDESHPCEGRHPCVVVDEMCNGIALGAGR